MKITLPEQINLNDVAATSRRLAITQQIGRSKFFIELPERDCKNGIWSAFIAQLRAIGRVANPDPDTLQRISEIAQWLLNPQGKPSLMLQGTMGTGKTLMAKGLGNFIKFVTGFGDSARSTVVPTYVKAKKVCEQFVRYPDDYERLRTTRILIIDDLGEEPSEVLQYGMTYTPMLDLLEERYDMHRCTIVTTNLKGEELEKHYGQRLRDRFREMFETVMFIGPSRR